MQPKHLQRFCFSLSVSALPLLRECVHSLFPGCYVPAKLRTWTLQCHISRFAMLVSSFAVILFNLLNLFLRNCIGRVKREH